MALSDDLSNYMARNRLDSIPLDRPEVVMVGELHGRLRTDVAGPRVLTMRRLVRELLSDQRFRYFGNESFQNAGPVRSGVRDYWERAALAPAFDNTAPGAAAMNEQEVGRRVTPRRFQPVLDDLRARPRYLLSIGSRSNGNDRDHRLAQHFLEEVSDRGIARHTPGVLLLGASHAAATPYFLGQPTTRMMLERRGYRCTSIRLITDATVAARPDDTLYPLASGRPQEIRLGNLTLHPRISFSTRASPDSPFFNVRDSFSDSGRSLAEQFEFIVFERG